MEKISRSPPGEPGPLRIAFVHLSSLCWNFFEYHLRIRAKQAEVVLIDKSISTVAEQIAVIDSLLRENLDVLVFRPMATDHAELLAALQRAQAAGVRLISIDGVPGGSIDTCSIAADNMGWQ